MRQRRMRLKREPPSMTVVTEWTCEQVVLWLGEAGFDNFKEVVVLPPTNLPEIPKVGRRRFYNSKVGRDIRLNSTYPHRVLSGPKGSCVMCFSDSTSGRRRELTTTKKCLTCQVHLCAKTFGEYTTSCFEAFHEQDTLDMRARPPPRPRVMYILPNWDPAKDSYESLKRENLRMQLQHQS
ncbi:hypothetical protein DYB36_013438 [Aphanomyces astaci]|uniref:SAM domain-containing protein n=1 Tax=Aphanomyces astaci TaxID=112090 RepID=A0A397A3X0_APHAT|nr:hypothetical protein DYB36_013438 [Aphanomyces astaci]